jgi:hypothetical protein
MKLSEIAQSELEKLLTQYEIDNYTIRDDGLVDVDGHVNLSRGKFENFPIKFGRVTGHFSCHSNDKLISLEGGPSYVGGSFDCHGCRNLISLKGAPSIVDGDFYCFGCINLTSLKGSPQSVKDFNCTSCIELTSFNELPREINGKLTVHDLPKVKNYLSIFKIKKVMLIYADDYNLQEIINKYLPTRDVIGCQDELIEAGYEKYARTK